MGHNLVFIFTILGLAGSVIVLMVWKCWWWSYGEEVRKDEEKLEDKKLRNNIVIQDGSKNTKANKRIKNKKENIPDEEGLDQYEAPAIIYFTAVLVPADDSCR